LVAIVAIVATKKISIKGGTQIKPSNQTRESGRERPNVIKRKPQQGTHTSG